MNDTSFTPLLIARVLGLALLVMLSPTVLSGCSADSDETQADTTGTGDAEGSEDGGTNGTDGLSGDGSYYDLTIALPSGLQQKLTGEILSETQIAYGSTHIAPAVSLAVNITYPKPYATVGMNLGFVKGSTEHPITIEDTGEWAWTSADDETPPAFSINISDKNVPRNFASWTPGAAGSYIISKWGTEPGEIIEGTVSGTLVNDGPEPLEAVVQGEFRIVIPTDN